MPNHFAAIGFAVRDEDDLQELADAAIEHGDVVPVRGGIVSGEFYLSGRVIAETPPPRRGWIRRLTGR